MKTQTLRPPLEAIQLLRGLFDPKELKSWWQAIEPRNYKRKVHAWMFVFCIFGALVLRLSSIKRIIYHYRGELNTPNESTLSYCARRVTFMWMGRRMLDKLQNDYPCPHRRGDVIVWDSMSVDVSEGRSTDAQPKHSQCYGGGVMWSINLDALQGENPIQAHKYFDGCWNDTYQVRKVQLVPNGPINLMDPGFYGFKAINNWNHDQVRYICRAKAQNFQYHVIEQLSEPRTLGNGTRIKLDALVLLGSPNNRHQKNRPMVRLVIAELPPKPKPASAKAKPKAARKAKPKPLRKATHKKARTRARHNKATNKVEFNKISKKTGTKAKHSKAAKKSEPQKASKKAKQSKAAKRTEQNKAKQPSQQDRTLLLVSNPMDRNWAAEFILQTYGRRSRIETFHRMLKSLVGLAHLYSFQRLGMRLMLMIAVMVVIATCLLVKARGVLGDSVDVLHAELDKLRARLVVEPPWQRNTPSPKRAKRQSRAGLSKSNALKEVLAVNH